MSGKFTHYLVTRFNVPLESWLKDPSRRYPADANWFNHRLDLFTTICIPSVVAQSNQNFQWLVYCDAGMDPEQLSRLQKILEPIPNVTIRFATDKDSFLKDLRNFVHRASTPKVVTSRLDNDDGIGQEYIAVIQKAFSEESNLLLNFRTGLCYDLQHHVLTRIRSDIPNAFTSLIEQKEDEKDLMTVYAFHHTEVPSHVKLRQVDVEDQWLKIIHDRNVKSSLKGKPILQWPRTFSAILPIKQFPVYIGASIGYFFKRIGQRI